MEKEMKITAPKGCVIERIKIVDGTVVLTLKAKEWELPKSWEEFCENYPIKDGESYINNISIINKPKEGRRRTDLDRNMLPNRAAAEAIIALSQLIQLRNCYNGDWVPDWTDEDNKKYVIEFYRGKIKAHYNTVLPSTPLYFKTEELRDKFLLYFHDLIEKLKPLYGIY